VDHLLPFGPQDIPGQYGVHGTDLFIDHGPLTIITVDPGHAMLIGAVRQHTGAVVEDVTTNKRKEKLRTMLAKSGRTHFSLSLADGMWSSLVPRQNGPTGIDNSLVGMYIPSVNYR
jgi:hypothetical protein